MIAEHTRRRPSIVTVLVMLVILGAVEAGARLAEPRVFSAPQWGSRPSDTKVAQIQELAAGRGADIVFLGSSAVEVGVDPAVFLAGAEDDLSAYNASITGASPRVLEAWASELVFPLLEPSIVVIGLTSRDMNDEGLDQERVYHQYLDSPGRLHYLGEPSLLDDIEWEALNASALLRVRSAMRSPSEFVASLSYPGNGAPRVTELGRVSTPSDWTYSVSDEFREDLTMRSLQNYHVGGVELDALTAIVQQAHDRGAVVYLVEMPVVAEDYYPLHPNGATDVAEFEAVLADYVASQPVVWLDSAPGAWDRSFFGDPLHMNSAGTERFSRWLAEVIETH
jgi:hypothetical protein